MENYKILSNIGEGCYGIVYRAKNRVTKQKFAIKKIALRKIETQGFPINVFREIKILQHIRDNENEPYTENYSETGRCCDLSNPSNFIISLYESFSHGSGFCLVFDFMVSDLSEVIKSHPAPLTVQEIKSFMIMITRGIDFIHNQQFIHRDIKPANILLSSQGQVKIADFGLARIFSHKQQENFRKKYSGENKYENIELLQYSHQVATRWYRAPELLYGSKEYDRGIDIWALGAIFAELFTRSPIFRADTDIEQICVVTKVLGTAKYESWPEMRNLPDVNKIEFPETQPKSWSEVLPEIVCPVTAKNLISKILVYSACDRMGTTEILDSEFFNSLPTAVHWSELPVTDKFRKKLLQKEVNAKESVLRDIETIDMNEFDIFPES